MFRGLEFQILRRGFWGGWLRVLSGFLSISNLELLRV